MLLFFIAMNSSIFHPRKDQILQRLQEFSFPRMIGTQGEKHAQLYLLSLLKKLGFTPKMESFLFNPRHVLIDVIKYGSIIALEAILAVFFLMGDANLILISILFQICFITIIYFIQKQLQHKFIHKVAVSSKNLRITQESQRSKEFGVKMAKILLVTHYDSQNSKISPKITFLMQKALKYSLIFLHFFTLLYGILRVNFIDSFLTSILLFFVVINVKVNKESTV